MPESLEKFLDSLSHEQRLELIEWLDSDEAFLIIDKILEKLAPVDALRYVNRSDVIARRKEFAGYDPPPEVEHVAWCRYTERSIVTCDQDAPGAFRVYRSL